MGRLILLALAAAALVHLYFYLAFGSAQPCEAAAVRMLEEQAGEVGEAFGGLVAGPLEGRLRSKGVLTCYRAALGDYSTATLQ